MKTQGKPSESKKADENTSDVSSHLPAAQKEVRKFDGMLGSVRIVMRENKPWFVAKEVAAFKLFQERCRYRKWKRIP